MGMFSKSYTIQDERKFSNSSKDKNNMLADQQLLLILDNQKLMIYIEIVWGDSIFSIQGNFLVYLVL